VKEWHPAQVPGVVQTDLLRNRLIAEPFLQDNEFKLQWIGLTDWEYRTQLPVDAATLAHSHVDLVFEGLDTFADVYVNDNAVLHTDNMFRRWSVPAKALLRPGNNSLRIVFHSAVTRMLLYVKSLAYVLPAISTMNGGNEEDVPTAPYTRKAPYQYGWDWGPRFVTEGIWQPVRLETWDAAKGGNERILTYMLREYREPKNFEAFVYLSQVQQAEIIKLGAEHLRRQRPRTMGSLYWQLNDCWPVASWASIDYYGRWKALHYYARRFYDDVLISPYLQEPGRRLRGVRQAASARGKDSGTAA
jgi:beta-galactosidase/beta-glucuronidase